MLIALFGENCSGKSNLAEVLKQKLGAEVYLANDYLRLGHTESEARQRFEHLLLNGVHSSDSILCLINQQSQLNLLPEGCIRVLVTAPLEDIKARFAARMNGVLPAAVASMLERNHGIFDDVPHDIHIRSGERHVLEDCAYILALCDGRQ